MIWSPSGSKSYFNNRKAMGTVKRWNWLKKYILTVTVIVQTSKQCKRYGFIHFFNFTSGSIRRITCWDHIPDLLRATPKRLAVPLFRMFLAGGTLYEQQCRQMVSVVKKRTACYKYLKKFCRFVGWDICFSCCIARIKEKNSIFVSFRFWDFAWFSWYEEKGCILIIRWNL